MSLNRRDFVKLCTGTVAGFGVAQMFHPAVREALAGTLTGERPPVIWLQGQGCTGCSVSLLNNVNPSIADVLLKIISLEYHPTVMGGEGHDAYTHMMNIAKNFKGKFFLAIEGSIPLAKDGRYCVVAEEGHTEITMADLVKKLAPDAAAVLALGTCAAYGGIPAAKGSVTEAVGTGALLKQAGIKTPVVNIPGCPPQPDWIVGTIALALQKIKEKGLEAGLAEVVSLLDSEGRPLPFYGRNVHENCPYLGKYDEGKFSATFTEKDGCRYDLGCKGPGAYCDSFERKWNGVNWCVANAICIGCTEPTFPDGQSPFYSNSKRPGVSIFSDVQRRALWPRPLSPSIPSPESRAISRPKWWWRTARLWTPTSPVGCSAVLNRF